MSSSASLHYLEHHFHEQWFGKDLTETVLSTVHVMGDEDCSEYVGADGPGIGEDKFIEEKTEFEKTFILKHRSLFSEKFSLVDLLKPP